MSKASKVSLINIGPDTSPDTLGAKNPTSEHFRHPPYHPLSPPKRSSSPLLRWAVDLQHPPSKAGQSIKATGPGPPLGGLPRRQPDGVLHRHIREMIPARHSGVHSPDTVSE